MLVLHLDWSPSCFPDRLYVGMPPPTTTTTHILRINNCALRQKKSHPPSERSSRSNGTNRHPPDSASEPAAAAGVPSSAQLTPCPFGSVVFDMSQRRTGSSEPQRETRQLPAHKAGAALAGGMRGQVQCSLYRQMCTCVLGDFYRDGGASVRGVL